MKNITTLIAALAALTASAVAAPPDLFLGHQAVPTKVTAPLFGTLTLPDGGNYLVTPISVTPTVVPGKWQRSIGGQHPAKPGEWVQWMGETTSGWTDTILRVDEKGNLARARHNDPSYRLDAPWWDGSRWRDGWVRVWPSAPPGAWFNEVWPRAALTVKTNRSRVAFTVTGAPSEVELYGSDNVYDGTVDLGPQSRLMIDRAACRIFGDRNALGGSIRTEMTAVRVYGTYNAIRNLSAEGLEVGNDVGLIVFGRGYDGNSIENVFAMCRQRRYPASWVMTAVYCDDRTGKNSIRGLYATGFQSAVFVHGGESIALEGVYAKDCEVAVTIAPHFTTPTVSPKLSPVGTVRLTGEAGADRKVPALMGNPNARYITDDRALSAAGAQ